MAEPTFDTAASLAFLKRFHPEGPWVITAIEPEGGGIDTRAYGPGDEKNCAAFIDTYQGRRNLYFSVNEVISAQAKKASRENIARVRWLHVDIDPHKGESLVDAQTRAINALQSPPEDVPPPTVIVFSGGGYQGFWKLEQPLVIRGEVERYERAKLYNQRLEKLFGADNCHNVDRIMRVPGTVNLPNKKKRAAGRTRVVAELIVFDESRVYPITSFKPYESETEGGHAAGPNEPVNIAGDLRRFDNMAELDKAATSGPVPDRIKAVIVTGADPNDEDRYESRSEALWAVVCELVRCGLSDKDIFSVITDPNFSISESVRQKGSAAQKYAIKQITDAKKKAIHPKLREYNDKYAVVARYGGKSVIISEMIDPIRDTKLLYVESIRGFKEGALCNDYIQIGKEAVSAPAWWLRHPQRRTYDRMLLAPGRDLGPDIYNLWQGYGVEQSSGDCSMFLSHIRKNVCAGVEEHYDYLLGWLARLVQKPGTPGQVAVVMRGERGTGKSFFAEKIGRLLGRHYLKISNPSHLVGNFNAHLQQIVLLFADEGFYAGDKKHANVLKDLVTGDTLAIERKGFDVENYPNYLHIIMASNNDWVVPAGHKERRYFVLDVGDGNLQDGEYFGAVDAQMESGGYEALLDFLMNYDLAGYNVRRVPATKALLDQLEQSQDPHFRWWQDKLERAEVFAGEGWPERVECSRLYADYLECMNQQRVPHPMGERLLGKQLLGMLPAGAGFARSRVRVNDERKYIYLMPFLDQCRAAWDKLTGQTIGWPAIEDEVVEETLGGPVF